MMNVESAQTSLKGLVQDFFETTWARLIDMSFLLLVSTWVWCAGVSAILNESGFPRPIDWYRGPVESMGWQMPTWIVSLSDWRSPEGMWWPQAAVLGVAIACSLRARTSVAPGYRLSALVLLVASCQWFGVKSTFAGFVSTSAFLTLMALIRSGIDQRFGERDNATYSYLPNIVLRVFVYGPLLVLVLPFFAPVLALVAALRSFAFDNRDFIEPSELATVTAVVDGCPSGEGTAAQMSTRRLALLLTAAQLAAAAESGTRSKIAQAVERSLQSR